MSLEKPAPAILWFRKDLRLDDNPALHAAIEAGGPVIPVIPVYIREPAHLNIGPLGAAQAWWLHHSLAALKASLKSLNSDLILASGKAEDVLADLARKTNATTVFVNRAYERTLFDRGIAIELKKRDIAIRAFHGQLLREPKSIRTGAGGAFRVFTPFWNALQKVGEPHEPMDAPTKIPSPEHFPPSENLDHWALLPKKPDWAADFGKIWAPGEAGAQEKLADVVDRELHDYRRGRDLPSVDATSLLSPHLAHGEVSAARIWHAVRGLPPKASEDVAHFRRELAWRDFCYNLLAEFPELHDRNWDDRFDGFKWEYDAWEFSAWTAGLTGYPIVDAGMRQLWRTGFMHNRVRMITASFLIKDLMIDWRRGERWFRDTLVDADPANNSANWQWVAGSGADASPFFRIFNPVLQGEKFDPDGDYVREHVPELARLDRKYVHKPFEAPEHVLEKAGIELGKTYPKPIVDHAFARDRALSAYRDIR
ncbi:DNA photolyase family protein [Neorhizobium galegae]|uniref:cryptochrome/photolyase family protein n=1 Tax=Neorhizobium galegae TaxID=399 RepID=UPI00062156C6|nr:DNA photolyase family protein [Neorhizobium galegae]MCQ1797291.1 DNA photolyase family protein [Neorhizobium galegae]CDZ27271.1 Deoxyribodipyrimidine photo-lyase [Neorhizobium galegae bv. officinalis]